MMKKCKRNVFFCFLFDMLSVFSEVEQEKSGTSNQNSSNLVQSGVSTQQSQPVTLQVRVVIKLI